MLFSLGQTQAALLTQLSHSETELTAKQNLKSLSTQYANTMLIDVTCMHMQIAYAYYECKYHGA